MIVASYNILADSYIRPEYYPGVPAEQLDPRNRRPVLLERVAELRAQVVCLQEVEHDVFEELRNRMPQMRGHYLQKGRGKPDGCATFVDEGLHVCGTDELRYPDGTGHVALLCSVLFGRRQVVVANTHLRWDAPEVPPHEQVGLAQMEQLIAAVRGRGDGSILCGDFNAGPDSGLVQAAIRAGYEDPWQGQCPPTFGARGSARCLDFMLHSPELHCLTHPVRFMAGAATLPTMFSFGEPSDHLPIKGTFRWVEAGPGDDCRCQGTKMVPAPKSSPRGLEPCPRCDPDNARPAAVPAGAMNVLGLGTDQARGRGEALPYGTHERDGNPADWPMLWWDQGGGGAWYWRRTDWPIVAVQRPDGSWERQSATY